MTLATADPRTATRLGRSLTKEELAQASGLSLEVIRKWTADGTIPDTYFVQGDRGNDYRYSPITMAVIELVQELAEFFGPKSPIPKAAGRQVAPALLQYWPRTNFASLTIRHGDLEVEVKPLRFLDRAHKKLAAIAA